MGKRRLFCEISPLTYKISVFKCRTVRYLKDFFSFVKFAREKSQERLPVSIYKHSSLIRRRLGNVDLRLQENKAVNLGLAAPKVSGILIRPGETFSFWRLVGKCSAKKGYREGLTISRGNLGKGIGGGMCQFTNMIHWLVLHTPLEIAEHHHHDGLDLFPDYGRKVPFGTGTSILYNYLDYRFKNNTDMTFQLIVYTDEEFFHGEIRAEGELSVKYHIKVEDECFMEREDGVYRYGKVFRVCVDKATGELIERKLIKTNWARVMYDVSGIDVVKKTG